MGNKKFVDLAKKIGLKTIISHRGAETEEFILSDLAYGFQTDFIKISIGKPERDVKWDRLEEIEENK